MLNTGMGINQIVNANLGNPAPLAKKVEQSQQGQQGQPGKLPLDLKYALALQEIDALKKAAANQQSMQAGGEQPTVVDKLEQMLKGDSEQAQPQQGGPNEPAPFNPQQAAQGQPPQGMPQVCPKVCPKVCHRVCHHKWHKDLLCLKHPFAPHMVVGLIA